MDKMKKKILIAIICMSIVLIIIVAYICIRKQNIEITKDVDDYYPEEGFYVDTVKDSSEFYTIKNITDNYITAMVYDEKEQLLNILDKKYIEDNEISSENISNKLSLISLGEINESNEIIISINKMHLMQKQNSYRIRTYFVSGDVKKDKDSSEKINFSIMIETDEENLTYHVLPYEYIEERGYVDIKVGDVIQIDTEEIPNNTYNTFEYQTVTDEKIIWDYFSNYKDSILYGDINEAYELLQEEYREKKFGNLEGYQKYIQNNIVQIIKSNIESYRVTTEENKTKYICIDQYGNYYIFTENAVMDYTVILDTYTINLPEFTEKYNNATEQQKVALNIDKFIQAINAKDYKYAYNCLADSFKSNYFKTQSEFEEYIKTNFYESNTIKYNEFNIQGEYYTYSVILTDKNTGEEMNKTFVMQLKEGTEFVMSFDK